MKKIISINRFVLMGIALTALLSCSSDSSDTTPEPDTVAPTLDFTISGTSSGSEPIVVSNQMEININAQDAKGISKVEAFIDDEKVGEDTTAPYQITIDVSNYTSKNNLTAKFTDYTLKVTVTDTSGNETSKEQVIHIDNEEKKKIRRLREEQARASQRRDNDSDDGFLISNDNII